MKIYRKELLAALDSCAAGLGTKGSIEQSSCYIFRDNKVVTFNDIVYTEIESPVPLDAAVPAKAFRDTLAKFGDDEIDVEQTDSKIRISAKSKRATINGHTDVYLPTNEVEKPGEWVDVPPELSDALPMAADAAGTQGDILDNLCIHPRGIVACDRSQAIQMLVVTGARNPCLIPAEGIKSVASLGIAGVYEGENWVHFRTYTGLLASVRKSTGEYPDVLPIFQTPVTSKFEFPFSATDAFERLVPFLSDTTEGRICLFTVQPGALILSAKNVAGKFEERIDIEYDGPVIAFSAAPKTMASAVRHGCPLNITDTCIRITGSGFRYAVSITHQKDKKK